MKRHSIKTRAAIGATAFCILMIAFIGLLQKHFLRVDLTNVIADQQFTLVSRVADDIDTKLSMSLEAISLHATAFPTTILNSPSQIRQHYAVRPVVRNMFDDVLVFAANGQLIADTPELPARQNLNASDRAFFKEVMANRRAVISEPVISKTRREPIIQIAAPILDANGEIAGVVVGVIRLYKPNFLGNLGDVKVGKTGYFSLSTRTTPAVYVAHPEKARILKPHGAGTPPAVTNALAGFEGSVEGVTRGGISALFTSKNLRMSPWMLLIVAPTAEVFLPIAHAEERLLITLVVVSLLVLPIMWFLTGKAMGPIIELRDKIDALRSAPASFVPITVKHANEFGDLTRDFNLLMQERLSAQAMQQKSESQLQMIADNTPALIAFIDCDMKYSFVNRYHAEWYGRPLTDFTGRSPSEVFGDERFEPVSEYFVAALKGERVKYESARNTAVGTRYSQTVLIPHLNEVGNVAGIFKLTTDVTSLKQVELSLEDLVRHDPLTGAFNRRGFDEQLQAALQRNARDGRWLALLVIDIDYFKHINDQRGHADGDDVLKEFTQRLTASVRETDTVARTGGDEFAVVLEEVHSPAYANDVAGKILQALKPAMLTHGGNFNVTASIGIGLCHRGMTDAVALLRQADEAVYAAKANGRNQFFAAETLPPSLTIVKTEQCG